MNKGEQGVHGTRYREVALTFWRESRLNEFLTVVSFGSRERVRSPFRWGTIVLNTTQGGEGYYRVWKRGYSVPCLKRDRERWKKKVSHLPSGVVEVLEIPEEAGLFLSVAGRILIQDAGHTCWARRACAELRRLRRWRWRTTRATNAHTECTPEERARWLLVSAGRPRAFHVVVVGGLCIVITGSGGGRYLRRGGSVTDAHTPRCSHVRGDDGGGGGGTVQSAARVPYRCRPAAEPPRTSSLGGGTREKKKTHDVYELLRIFLYSLYTRTTLRRNTQNGDTQSVDVRVCVCVRWRKKKLINNVWRRRCPVWVGVWARAYGAVFRAGPTRRARLRRAEKKKQTKRSRKTGEKSKFTRRSGRPFVIAQCVHIGRVAPTPPTEYCPNIKTSRAHVPRSPNRPFTVVPTIQSLRRRYRRYRGTVRTTTAQYNILCVCVYPFFISLHIIRTSVCVNTL